MCSQSRFKFGPNLDLENLLDHLCYSCLVSVVPSSQLIAALWPGLVVICWERTDLLALVCDVSLCCCHFPMWYPGSGVVLDCIDS